METARPRLFSAITRATVMRRSERRGRRLSLSAPLKRERRREDHVSIRSSERESLIRAPR